MNKDDVLFYKKNGYVIAKNLISKSKIKEVLCDANNIFTSQLKYKATPPKDSDLTLFENMKLLFENDKDAYLAGAKLCAKLTSFKRLSMVKEFDDVVNHLGILNPTSPTEAIFHIMSGDLQIEGKDLGFKPHQDWASMQGSLNSISAWAPFTDIDDKSFPIQIIPGSHKAGLLDSNCNLYDKGTFESEMSNNSTEISINYDDWLTVIIQPGDVVFFSSWLVHRTKIDNCDSTRISMSTRYENPGDATWIERLYPSAYQRVVRRDLITKDFPSLEQIKDVFDGGLNG